MKGKKKESQSAHFRSLGRWTGNNSLFKGGLKQSMCRSCFIVSFAEYSRLWKYFPLKKTKSNGVV